MIFHLRMTFLATSLLLASSHAAHSNPDICADIQRRLNSGSVTIGNSGEIRAIARAINENNALLRQIRSDMRRSGCSVGSVIVFGDKNAELCGELGDRLIAVRAELDFLNTERQNAQFTRRSGLPDHERYALEDAWDQYECAAAQLPPPTYGLDTRPDVEDETFSEERAAPSPVIIDPMKKPATQSTIRTMCVRLCDGKFYPISGSATPLDFASHREQCQNSCKGAPTGLFYHYLEGQETKDMVSATTNEPYLSLPNAYRFQSEARPDPNQCSCGLGGSTEFGEKPKPLDAMSPEIIQQRSVRSGPPAEKIEPKSTNQSASNLSQPVDEGRPYNPGERKVRNVGPQFFPEDNNLDLANPATSGAQPQQF